jgi:hypothetical protein
MGDAGRRIAGKKRKKERPTPVARRALRGPLQAGTTEWRVAGENLDASRQMRRSAVWGCTQTEACPVPRRRMLRVPYTDTLRVPYTDTLRAPYTDTLHAYTGTRHSPGCEARPQCHSCVKKTPPLALTADTTGFHASSCSWLYRPAGSTHACRAIHTRSVSVVVRDVWGRQAARARAGKG